MNAETMHAYELATSSHDGARIAADAMTSQNRHSLAAAIIGAAQDITDRAIEELRSYNAGNLPTQARCPSCSRAVAGDLPGRIRHARECRHLRSDIRVSMDR